MKEAGVTESEVKSLIEKFDDNVTQELDIDEGEMCFEGWRLVNGFPKRGVPHRNKDD